MHRSYKCSYRTEIGDGINAVMDIFGEDGREDYYQNIHLELCDSEQHSTEIHLYTTPASDFVSAFSAFDRAFEIEREKAS